MKEMKLPSDLSRNKALKKNIIVFVYFPFMKSCTLIGNPHEKELTFSADFTRGALKTLRKKKQIIKKC